MVKIKEYEVFNLEGDMIDREMIKKTEGFLKETFENSKRIQSDEAERNYRLEHSIRVANIAREIGLAEGLDSEALYIGGLLHDIAYCEEWEDMRTGWINHGRRSAELARPFLESIGIDENLIQGICYGIAIHVDDKSDFEGDRNSFALTIATADNIDRFDVYRIYEELQYGKFSVKSLEEKQSWVEEKLQKLDKWVEMVKADPSNKTGDKWLLKNIDYQKGFYKKLKEQLERSL